MRQGAGSGSGWLMAALSNTTNKSNEWHFLEIGNLNHINYWINDFQLSLVEQ